MFLKIKASKTRSTFTIIETNIGIYLGYVIRSALVAKKRDIVEVFRSFFDTTEVDYAIRFI